MSHFNIIAGKFPLNLRESCWFFCLGIRYQLVIGGLWDFIQSATNTQLSILVVNIISLLLPFKLYKLLKFVKYIPFPIFCTYWSIFIFGV